MPAARRAKIETLAAALLARCRAQGIKIACAESCTGGLVASAITDLPGASEIFDRGFVTYSNAAKVEMLGVRQATLDAFGAVSAETAQEMAQGALDRSAADVAVAITGIAGPSGGTPQKPVGLVEFACARKGGGATAAQRRYGARTRGEIRAAAAAQALEMLIEAVQPRP
jgi:nicotinamide-nucleotide amidase